MYIDIHNITIMVSLYLYSHVFTDLGPFPSSPRCMYVYMYVFICIYAYLQMFIFHVQYTLINLYRHKYMYVCININQYMHIHIYIHMLTHKSTPTKCLEIIITTTIISDSL
jgi:hypothetical protein